MSLPHYRVYFFLRFFITLTAALHWLYWLIWNHPVLYKLGNVNLYARVHVFRIKLTNIKLSRKLMIFARRFWMIKCSHSQLIYLLSFLKRFFSFHIDFHEVLNTVLARVSHYQGGVLITESLPVK